MIIRATQAQRVTRSQDGAEHRPVVVMSISIRHPRVRQDITGENVLGRGSDGCERREKHGIDFVQAQETRT